MAGRVVKALRCLSFGSKPLCLPVVSMDRRVKPGGYEAEVSAAVLDHPRQTLDCEKAQPSYNAAAENVSHPPTCPPLNPVENQRLRCAEVPWVKESGIA